MMDIKLPLDSPSFPIAHTVQGDTYEAHIPQKFSERMLRVYSKKSDFVVGVREAVVQYIESSLSNYKVKGVDCSPHPTKVRQDSARKGKRRRRRHATGPGGKSSKSKPRAMNFSDSQETDITYSQNSDDCTLGVEDGHGGAAAVFSQSSSQESVVHDDGASVNGEDEVGRHGGTADNGVLVFTPVQKKRRRNGPGGGA